MTAATTLDAVRDLRVAVTNDAIAVIAARHYMVPYLRSTTFHRTRVGNSPDHAAYHLAHGDIVGPCFTESVGCHGCGGIEVCDELTPLIAHRDAIAQGLA